MKKNNYFYKVRYLLSDLLRGRFFILVFLMLVSALIEIVGLGIIMPVISIFVNYSEIQSNDNFGPILIYLGSPDQISLMKYSLIFLVSSQAKPLPRVITSRLSFFRYSEFISDISNSPLFEGFKDLDILITSLL